MFDLKVFSRLSLLGLLVLFTGCATVQSPDERDPYESYNRAMYQFNDTVDRAVLKPVAKGYDAVVPDAISWGVSNFFSNLNDITVAINSLLQGKFNQAADDTGRFLLNSTVGVAGIFDVAGHADARVFGHQHATATTPQVAQNQRSHCSN